MTGIGVAETFMGKGMLDYEDPRMRSGPSACSRATTRSLGSTTPTS